MIKQNQTVISGEQLQEVNDAVEEDKKSKTQEHPKKHHDYSWAV